MEVADTVRKAVPENLPEVSSALSRAFFDDPLMAWAIPDEDRRQRAEDAACNLHLIGRCVTAVNTATTAVPRGSMCWSVSQQGAIATKRS
jgi:hypothetical protein